MVVVMTAAGNAIIGCFTAIKRCIMRCYFFNYACIRNTIETAMESCLNCLKKGQKIGVKQDELDVSKLESEEPQQKLGIIAGAKQEAKEKMDEEM